jgi:outer membrane protein assembly factor BamD
LALGVVEEARNAAAVLGYNYPDSVWYERSYALVESNGQQQSVSEGSWLSRVF